jgi:hypothetical protein
MRTFATWIAAIILSTVALFALVIWATSNVVELEYANYEQAAAAGAIARQANLLRISIRLGIWTMAARW